MFNFIFVSLITITFSSSNYTFKTIKSYSYIEYDKNNDTFINYPEKTEEIKIEILEDNTNYTFSSLNIYQYINIEDVRQDNNTNEFINFVYYSTFENNKTIKKKGDYFVITNNSPEKEHLSSIINYISFMPNIPNEKIKRTTLQPFFHVPVIKSLWKNSLSIILNKACCKRYTRNKLDKTF